MNLWALPRRRANEQAGLSTDGAWIMAGCPPGGWPQFVGFSGNQVLDSAASLLCVQQLKCKLMESQTDPSL